MSTLAQTQPTDAMKQQLMTTHMAATRTLLATVRTGSSIAAAGAVATDLLVKGWPQWVTLTLSACFVVLGYWLMWASLRSGQKMRKQYEIQLGKEGFLFSHRSATFFMVTLQLLLVTVLVLYFLD